MNNEINCICRKVKKNGKKERGSRNDEEKNWFYSCSKDEGEWNFRIFWNLVRENEKRNTRIIIDTGIQQKKRHTKNEKKTYQLKYKPGKIIDWVVIDKNIR